MKERETELDRDGDRDAESERETEKGFEPKRLRNSSSPTSCATLASCFSSLNLVFHNCEVRISIASGGMR